MSIQFDIQSSDVATLAQAIQIANEFAQQPICKETVGIVFLGAIARGYFDRFADIDIAFFSRPLPENTVTPQFLHVQGFEIHVHHEAYDAARDTPWDMAKRWTYSQGQIYYDPQGLIAQLLHEKVLLKSEERRWLLMSGLTLSEWYCNRLPQLWVERGNLISAHHMFHQGLTYFFDLLFALNNQLVADMKWRYYCVERLGLLPPHFHEHIQEILILNAVTVEEIERRQHVFMELWRPMVPLVEQKLQMPYDEIKKLV